MIREFAHLVGTLAAACWAVEYGRAYLKPLERCLYMALILNNYDYKAYMQPSFGLRCELKWWNSHIQNSNMPIQRRCEDYFFRCIMFRFCWGAACEGEYIHGFWKSKERVYHINYLELLAAFFALRSFAGDMNDCEILLRIDNTTAISYINKMGGVKYPKLSSVAKEIWLHTLPQRTINRIEADRVSRVNNIDAEWELAQDAFDIISRRFGSPEIDLFASRGNTKCKKFFAWHRDPEALGIDAFMFNWSFIFFYAFPPFSIITKGLNKIRSSPGHCSGSSLDCSTLVSSVETTINRATDYF